MLIESQWMNVIVVWYYLNFVNVTIVQIVLTILAFTA